jgi:hypothetical protein
LEMKGLNKMVGFFHLWILRGLFYIFLSSFGYVLYDSKVGPNVRILLNVFNVGLLVCGFLYFCLVIYLKFVVLTLLYDLFIFNIKLFL